MRKPADNRHKPPASDGADTFDAGFRAIEFRADLDALLTKHGMTMVLAHEGKWAHLQCQWPDLGTVAVSLCRASRGGKMRYLPQADEPG